MTERLSFHAGFTTRQFRVILAWTFTIGVAVGAMVMTVVRL